MELSKEEKKAIEELKEFIEDDEIQNISVFTAKKIKNIIEQQQKGIEKIKDKNKTLEGLLQGNLYELYLYYKELASKYQANSISKDKIREIFQFYIERDSLFNDDTHKMAVIRLKDVLQELLEEK